MKAMLRQMRKLWPVQACLLLQAECHRGLDDTATIALQSMVSRRQAAGLGVSTPGRHDSHSKCNRYGRLHRVSTDPKGDML